jgi:hypothetical protein
MKPIVSLPWLVLSALGCSTLAPLPTPEECTSDEDCPEEGELCAPDTGICVPIGNVPPRADLGFDIQELVGGVVAFRAEVSACDRTIAATQSSLGLRGRHVEQTFDLEIFVGEPADSQTPTIEELLAGSVELSQASRFARTPLVAPRVDYPSVDTSSEVPTLRPTSVRWPRYHPFDELPPSYEDGGFVLWRSIPDVGAPVLQMLVPPQLVPPQPEEPDDDEITSCTMDTQCCSLDSTGLECEDTDPNLCVAAEGLCTAIGNPRFAYTFGYVDECARDLVGKLVVVDGETLDRIGGIAGVQLTVRHADTSDEPTRLGVHAIDPIAPDQREPQCQSDAQCIEGEQFCDPDTDQCVLALAGRQADNGSTVTEEDVIEPRGEAPVDTEGRFSAAVYTYCESNPTGGGVRSFTVSAAPSGPLAALSYTIDTSVTPITGGIKPEILLPKDLCVPDWGAPVPLSVQLVGTPVEILGTGDDAYKCCDIGCLPASPDVATVEPTQLASCDGRTSGTGALNLVVSADLVLDDDDLDAWDTAGCQPPDADANGVVGGIRRKMDCSGTESGATCVAPELAAGKDGAARDYVLRIESPVGSFFSSRTIDLEVTPDPATQEIALESRVLVRGRVLLDATACEEAANVDGDCGSEGAIIRAERLRMPGETDADAVAPYFHEVPTYYDPISGRQGEYVLPLDRGVYLLDAVPLSGSRGGPATIQVIDLRERESLDTDLILSSGQLVTLDLTGFDPGAQILPLDRGSWRDELHPGRADDADPARRTVDLNAIGECWQPADEPPQACRIRRLISGASLSASQVGQVRFTARIDEDVPPCPE